MSWRDADGILRPGRKPGSRNKVQAVAPKDAFGKWTVVRRVGSDGRGEPLFSCRCVCGTRQKLTTSNLTKGRSGSCGCSPPTGPLSWQWKGCGELSGDFWNQIRRGATREKGRTYAVQFKLTIEYAWNLFTVQNRKCALSGMPLTMSRERIKHTTSLDRIDSKKGYVVGNVQWVHKEINMMKRTMTQKRFVELCKLVANL